MRPLPADLRLLPGQPVLRGIRMNTRALRDCGVDPAAVLVEPEDNMLHYVETAGS